MPLIFMLQAAAFHGVFVASHSCTAKSKATENYYELFINVLNVEECDAREA